VGPTTKDVFKNPFSVML